MSFVEMQNLPPHWGEVKLKWQASRYAGGTPSRENLSFWGGDIPWLGSGEVNQVTITVPTEYISEEGLACSSAKWVPRGSLVMALAGQGKTKGMVARMGIDATCNQSLAAIVPQDSRLAGYIFWWLTSCYQDIRNLAGGDGRDGLNLELIGNIRMPAPPCEEQIAIAAFLDYETSKIDELIVEQEKLIALLEEKRQAVISHAVTGGGNSVNLTPAKNAAYFINGHAFKPTDWGDEGLPIVRIAQLQGNAFDNNFNGDCPERCHINNGDLLFSWSATLDSFIWNRGPAYLNQHIFKVIPRANADLRFLYYSLKHYAPLWGEIDAHGSTMRHIKRESLSNGIWLPSLAEQRAIVEGLDHALGMMITLQEAACEGIDLLRERRSALISAAVTGKIDVRNHPAAVAAINKNKEI